jgi:hypothetical protein
MKKNVLNLTLGVTPMAFNEFRRRKIPPEDPGISATDKQAETSFFRDPVGRFLRERLTASTAGIFRIQQQQGMELKAFRPQGSCNGCPRSKV